MAGIARAINQPINRSLAGTITTMADGATPEASGWDPDNSGLSVVLSNTNFTASAADDGSTNSFSTASANTHSAGKYVAKAVLSYGAGSESLVRLGVVPALWDATGTNRVGEAAGSLGGGYEINANGYAAHSGMGVNLSIPIPSGSYATVWINFDTGKIWLGNEAYGPSGEPEDGFDQAYTFVPNTPMRLATTLYSADGATPSIAALDVAYSSGTFAAWG